MMGITLSINDKILAAYAVQRIKPVDRQPSPSTVCEYIVTDDEGNEILGEHIFHRYGWGAEALAYRVLGKLKRRMYGKRPRSRRTHDSTL